MPDELVRKSVRLPSEMVDFIESLSGKDFTQKLLNLIREYRDGESQRQESIACYEQLVKANRDKLNEQSDTIFRISRILLHLQKALDEINNLPFS